MPGGLSESLADRQWADGLAVPAAVVEVAGRVVVETGQVVVVIPLFDVELVTDEKLFVASFEQLDELEGGQGGSEAAGVPTGRWLRVRLPFQRPNGVQRKPLLRSLGCVQAPHVSANVQHGCSCSGSSI